MDPIIGGLIAKGLSVLAGAVLSKGKDVIEEKLGVNLEEALTSEEGLYNLKKLEIEHEQFLVEAAQKKAEFELKEVETYLADTANARTLGVELSKSASWLNQNIMPVLAILTLLGGAWMLLDNGNTSEVKMAAVSFITMVLGYFFGSSKGSKDKQEQLARYAK